MKKKQQKNKGQHRQKALGIVRAVLLILGAFGHLLLRPYLASADEKDLPNTASAGQAKQLTAFSDDKILERFVEIIQDSKVKYETDFDFITDASLQKYISVGHPLNEITYTPADLEQIDTTYIVNKINTPLLRSPARNALEQMAQAFYEEFGEKLVLRSAYRSYESQKRLIDNGCSLKQCAEPGTSEHQLGLAVDVQVENDKGITEKLNNTNNKYYKRLDENAHKFGFHNTFKRGLQTDSEIKMEEHRHRRYCSIPVATFLYDNDLTLGEYVELNQQPE